MATAVTRGDELVYSDGRRELAANVDLRDSPLYNADLAPVPIERRTWNTYNYAALWVGMAHNIPTYLLASGLIALGMDWKQAILTLNLYIILRGMDTLRRFENWAAPFVLVVALFLLVWMYRKADGLGPILSQPSKLGWGGDFWPVFFPALMGMIAFWSTLSLNMPDFTRFGGSQRQQVLGQILGLPTTMTFFSLIAVLITSATVVVYGQAIWDPIVLTGKFSNSFVIVFALFTLVVATLSVNVAANVVSPSYDFSNAFPKLISFRTGGIITGVLGILIQPWRLLANPQL